MGFCFTKNAKKQEPEDRLSNLPDEILVKILSYNESYKEAVRCSVLSKRWRNLYTLLPCVHLTEQEICPPIEDESFLKSLREERKDKKKQEIKLRDNLSSVSLRHEQPIKTFCLEPTSHFRMWESLILDLMVHENKTEHITVLLPHFSYWVFPQCIFSCASLVTLKLEGFQLAIIPGNFRGFPNLRECELRLPIQDDDDAENLLTFVGRCPVLQNLKLIFHFMEETREVPIVISSDSLLHVDVHIKTIGDEETIDDEEPTEAVKLRIQTPELLTLKIGSDEDSDEEDGVSARVDAPKVVEVCVLSEYVHLLLNDIPIWFQGIVNLKRGKDHPHHVLSLEAVKWEENVEMIGIFDTLQFLHLSCISPSVNGLWELLAFLPLLEKLTLSECYFEDEGELEIEPCNMPRLEEICISSSGRHWLDEEEEVVRILLQNTPNFKALNLVLEDERMVYKDEYLKVFGEILCKRPGHLNVKETSNQVEFSVSLTG